MNETSMMILFFGGGAVLVVVVLVVGLIRARKRREAFRGVAEELGFDFEEKRKGVWPWLSGLPLFDRGHSKRSRNILRGTTREVEVCIFDYRYTVGGGKNSSTHKQSVIAFRSPSLDLPHFALRPENVLHKIGSAFGYQDIDFDGHPGFSSHYLLRGAHEEAVRRLFDDRVLNYFEQNRDLSVEGATDHLIAYHRSKRIKPEEVRGFIEQGFGIFQLFAGSEPHLQ